MRSSSLQCVPHSANTVDVNVCIETDCPSEEKYIIPLDEEQRDEILPRYMRTYGHRTITLRCERICSIREADISRGALGRLTKKELVALRDTILSVLDGRVEDDE